MQKKFNLKSFNLYEFLKHQNAHSSSTPFFLADRHTYKNAHVNFPFRTFAYGLGLSYTGKVDKVKIGSTDYTLQARSLTTVGPGLVCQWPGNYAAEHDTVYFTEELFKDIPANAFLQSLSFFYHGGDHVIRLTEDQTKKLKALFNVLKELKDDKDAVPGIVHAMLMLARSFHAARREQPKNAAISRRETIAHDFRKMVALHHPKHKDVSYYASNLHITPKYLSEVLQEELGKSAKNFIDEFVIMEAKSLLKQTTMSVQEICQWLGFDDASHFTKSFKKHTKVTPSAYRHA